MTNQQAPQSEGKVEISQSYSMPAPEEWKGFPVSRKDWDRIKKMVDRIISPTSFWQIAWPASFGIAFSALISALTIIEEGHSNKALCYWIFVLFLFIGLFSLLIDKTRREASTATKEQVKEEMAEMEKPYMQETPKATEEESKLSIIRAEYKTPNNKLDVAGILTGLIVDNKLKITATNDMFTDPEVGTAKTLEIEYSYNGKNETKIFNEKDTVELP